MSPSDRTGALGLPSRSAALAGVLLLLAGCTGTPRGLESQADADAASTVSTPADTVPLPQLGESPSEAEVDAWFGGRVPAHVYADTPERRGVEWHESMGRDVFLETSAGRLVQLVVRRPYVGHLPAVEARRLPALRVGQSAHAVEALVGPGWPVSRTRVFGGVSGETRGWAIRDRGLGTGRTLFVTFVADSVAAIAHPWVRP